MALDGGFIHNLIAELQSAVGSHIDKIHQPSRQELVLSLRSASGAKKLLISAVQGQSRIHFTETKPENPENPPTFCMLMRKYFGGAKITDISVCGLERTVKITACALNEMGDTVYPCIYAELIGASPNIVAVLNGRIIDAVHRSSLEKDGRMVLAGAVYTPPKSTEKLNPLEYDIKDIIPKILQNKSLSLEKSLLACLEGFSPLICREIAFKVGKDTDFAVKNFTAYHEKKLREVLEKTVADIRAGAPFILYRNGAPFDFSFTEITQYGKTETRIFDSFSALLDEFFAEQTASKRLAQSSGNVLKIITTAFSRAERRKNQRLLDLKKAEKREDLRLYGELIKANIHNISAGQTCATVQNYYDEELKEIKIPLDASLSPAANAAKYFKNYKKACVASQTLADLIKSDEEEIRYLDSVLDSLSRAESISDISEIKDELALAGYIKRPAGTARKKVLSAPLEFTSPSGYTVFVGKNNRQNDELTLRLSDKNDMWFHVKDNSGSHTVIHCKNGELTNEDILFAAKKAAEHSKSKNSSGVAVDYTQIKFVKKPAGAKAGMVIYSKNRTVFVTPNGE